jgi:uncharacterized protein (TIGR00297 family)
LAIGDGLLGISQRIFVNGPKLPWNSRKSWLGAFVGVLLSGSALALAGEWWDYRAGFAGEFANTRLALTVIMVFVCFVESMWFGIVDNLTIPFFSISFLAVILSVGNKEHIAAWVFFVPIVFSAGAIALKKVTPSGGVFGWWIAIALMYFSPPLFLFLLGFFVFGVLSTRYKLREKQGSGIAETRGGQRGVAEIFGSTAVMVLVSAQVVLSQGYEDLPLEMHRIPVSRVLLLAIAPLIAKTMDTVSSEMGKAIGGTTISLRSFKVVPPGTDGGVSFAGTLWGLAAAALLAALILPLHWGGAKEVGILVAIAILANLFESYWAAWAGPRGVDDGPHTNFMMTLFAATLAWFWWM